MSDTLVEAVLDVLVEKKTETLIKLTNTNGTTICFTSVIERDHNVGEYRVESKNFALVFTCIDPTLFQLMGVVSIEFLVTRSAAQ